MTFGQDAATAAIGLLSQGVDVGFAIGRARMGAKHGQRMSKIDQKRFAIDQQRQALLTQDYSRKGASPVMFILLGLGVVIAIVVGLAMFASSTASSTGRTGVIAVKGGKRVRRVRKRP